MVAPWLPTKRETYAALTFLLIGSILRLHQLYLVPLHHDEGVNGFFMLKLFREGVYNYDPANYHGPLLYYLDLPLLKFFGLETVNLRLLPALFGIGLLVLLFAGRLISQRAAIFSTALMAISPGMVYISRYFIHEMMVVFFTLGVVVAFSRYLEQQRAGWLVAAFSSAGFLFATKETAGPTIVVLVLAAILTVIWCRMVSQPKERPKLPALNKAQLIAGLAGGILLFVWINVILYSSFFTNWPGVGDAVRAFSFWTSTGNQHHVHPVWQYLAWLFEQEGPVFLLGLFGIVMALLLARSREAVFCAFWSLGMLGMYSLIPYKTPWLGLNIILPLGIMAGFGLVESARIIGSHAKVAVATAALLIGLWQCITLNFVKYDDNAKAYVYAHTVRDVERLVHDVEGLTVAYGPQTKVAVVTEHYWPLPWSWRNYQIDFHGRMVPLKDYKMVVSLTTQSNQVLQDRKQLSPYGRYQLRPGVDLVLWTDGTVTRTAQASPQVRSAELR